MLTTCWCTFRFTTPLRFGALSYLVNSNNLPCQPRVYPRISSAHAPTHDTFLQPTFEEEFDRFHETPFGDWAVLVTTRPKYPPGQHQSFLVMVGRPLSLGKCLFRAGVSEHARTPNDTRPPKNMMFPQDHLACRNTWHAGMEKC